jgi:hypothetical protein
VNVFERQRKFARQLSRKLESNFSATDNKPVCSVCFENEITPQNFTTEPGTVELACKHRFCKDCVCSYITTQIENQSLELTCLKEGCKRRISEQEIAHILPAGSELLAKLKCAFRQRLEATD